MPTVMAYADVVADIRARPGDVRLVGVDGYGGAGKSTFAARLARAAGNAPVIHTDDFASHDAPLHWSERFRADAIDPLLRGEPARFHPYDWVNRRFADGAVEVPPGPIVILEGVSATRAAWRNDLAIRIWINTPRDLCLQRGLDRDGIELADFWAGWQAEEDAYIAREDPARYADLVVDGAPTTQHDPETEFVVLSAPTAAAAGAGPR